MGKTLSTEPASAGRDERVVKRVLKYALALVVSAIAIYGVNYFTSDVAQAKPGDCATVSGDENGADYRAVPCESPTANVIIGRVLQSRSSACGGDFSRELIPVQGRGPDVKLCLIPKFAVGDCFREEPPLFPKVDCGTLDVMRVTKVVPNSTIGCEGASPLVFTEPLITYCVEPKS